MKQLSNSSYEEYMKDSLMSIASKFSVKSYKKANSEEWTGFERGVDLIVKILWENEPIFEFIIEKTFWNQRNINSKDRKHMRRFADQKIEMLKKCVTRKKSNVV